MSEQEPNPSQEGIEGEESITNIEKDILERAEGIAGSAVVLQQLAERGNDVYSSVSPNLGAGTEIYTKFKECDEDLDTLIERYSE